MAIFIRFTKFSFVNHLIELQVEALQDGLLICYPDPENLKPWSVIIRNSDQKIVNLPHQIVAGVGRCITKRYYPGILLNKSETVMISLDVTKLLPKDLPSGNYSITIQYFIGGSEHVGIYPVDL